MIHALNCFKIRASQLLKYKPVSDVGDYETLDITQRDLSPSYAASFDETISRRFSESPDVPVLETNITMRLFPKGKKLSAIAKAINGGKLPDIASVASTFTEDGQHRWAKVENFLASGLDPWIMVNFVVCDDDEATEVYLNINGKTRKPAPAVTDLFLAKKFKRTGKADPSIFARTTAALAVWHLTALNPLSIGSLERPLARPSERHDLKFHRTVGLMQRHTAAMNPETVTEQDLMNLAKRFHSAWEAVGLVLRPKLLSDGAEWCGLTKKDWNIPHLFNILTEGLVTPLLEVGLIGEDLISDAMKMRSKIDAFFEFLETDKDLTSGRNGFKGLGGASSEAPYVHKLREIVMS